MVFPDVQVGELVRINETKICRVHEYIRLEDGSRILYLGAADERFWLMTNGEEFRFIDSNFEDMEIVTSVEHYIPPIVINEKTHGNVDHVEKLGENSFLFVISVHPPYGGFIILRFDGKKWRDARNPKNKIVTVNFFDREWREMFYKKDDSHDGTRES